MSTRSSESSASSARANGDVPKRAKRRAAAPSEEPTSVEDHLRKRKVSELQEMWGFWQNGARPPARKQPLLDALIVSLQDEETVRSRVKVLSDRPREVLIRLLRHDGYAARLAELVDASGGQDLETYEVEAAARALTKRGFVRLRRESNGTRRGNETYMIPRDLGDLIAGLLQEERRGPREVFSLVGHLALLPPKQLRHALRFASETPDLGEPPEELARAALTDADPLARIEDASFRAALHALAVRRGGIALRTELEETAPELAAWDRKRLRDELEDAAIGTVTTLGLSAFGVDLGGETVVLFAEVVEQILDRERSSDATDGSRAPHAASAPEHDRVDAARVDLLTDLQQLLNLVAATPLRVTQGRTIYRAAQHRILDAFIFKEDSLVERSEVFNLVYSLAFGLELVEVTDESRLRLTKKGESWDSVELTEKVRAVYQRFLDERLPDARDFHVRRLRRALAAVLADGSAGEFLPISDVPFRVRNDYLSVLEEEGVHEQYKNRFRYTYSPPTETPQELTKRLTGYMLKRLYPLGVVDVALRGDEPVAIRLTEQGRRLIKGERLSNVDDTGEIVGAAVEDAQPLVVNPDFEVLHFPEGNVNEIAHALGRFAKRTKSERVAHYRISRETVERAVVKGMDADEMLEFLEANARAAVPQNVAYSIREWAERVAFVYQREGVILTSGTAEAMDAVLAMDEVSLLLVERPAPTVALLRSRITEWKLIDALRSLGVYLK